LSLLERKIIFISWLASQSSVNCLHN